MAAPKNPALTHRMRPPDVGRAAGDAAANDQDIAVHDFGFRPIHWFPLGLCRHAAPRDGSQIFDRRVSAGFRDCNPEYHVVVKCNAPMP